MEESHRIRKRDSFQLLLVLLGMLAGLESSRAEVPIGVNYGNLADNLSPPRDIVKLLKTSSIARVRLYDADSEMLTALANTGVEAVVGVPNEEIPRLTSPALANAWVAKNIVQHITSTKIRYISVGNEVLTAANPQLASMLVPALQNLHNALVSFKLDQQVKVSAPQSLAILSDVSFPPSSGSFRISSQIVKPVLDFLAQTRAPMMINAYPYFAYKSSPRDIPLDYALFLPNNGFGDSKTGLVYTNLLSAQLDAVHFAMEKLNYHGIEIVVSETGWPSIGEVSEPGPSVQNALTYNKNLISFVNSGAGTPARPRVPLEVYIFSLFNEDLKPGPASERNFGIFRPDGSLPYDLGLLKPSAISSGSSSSGNASSTPATTPASPPADQVPQAPVAAPGRNPPGNVWCIAKPNADTSSLLVALNYACGEGGADCAEIQSGAACFFPNDLLWHSSYAFNSYFVKHGGNKWNCNFGNTAMLVSTDPSYGICTYPPSK